MKKISMLVAVAAIAVSANAQKTTITAHNALDNIYVGVNGGILTTMKGDNSFSKFDPTFGIRVGKNFTTTFGLALDATARFNAKTDMDRVPKYYNNMNNTLIQNFDVVGLATINMMNMLGGYQGTPRPFEIVALGGFGWSHDCGYGNTTNGIVSKVALDFAYNFGSDNQWQVYLEPSLTYDIVKTGYAVFYDDSFRGHYDINHCQFGGKLGVNYKFKTSNGTHNFAFEQLRDQSEIDALNAQINGLRSDNDGLKSQNAAKDAKISELQKAHRDCQNKPAPKAVKAVAANLQPSVVFGQGKSNVERSQYANIELIARYMKTNKDAKIKISGYASPEGSAELNQKLSEQRANNVKDILVKKYKIASDRLTTEGLGATDKLFDEVEFNRVALFNDTTKK